MNKKSTAIISVFDYLLEIFNSLSELPFQWDINHPHGTFCSK